MLIPVASAGLNRSHISLGSAQKMHKQPVASLCGETALENYSPFSKCAVGHGPGNKNQGEVGKLAAQQYQYNCCCYTGVHSSLGCLFQNNWQMNSSK